MRPSDAVLAIVTGCGWSQNSRTSLEYSNSIAKASSAVPLSVFIDRPIFRDAKAVQMFCLSPERTARNGFEFRVSRMQRLAASAGRWIARYCSNSLSLSILLSPARHHSRRTVSLGMTRNLMSANVRERLHWAASVRASRVDRLAAHQEVGRECGCQVGQTSGILESLGTPIPRFSSCCAHE